MKMTSTLSGCANNYANERITFDKVGVLYLCVLFLKAQSELSTHDPLNERSIETFHFL